MGIFQTIKENKAIKQKLFIKKSINNMRRIVKKLDEQKDLYIRKARDAKLKARTLKSISRLTRSR